MVLVLRPTSCVFLGFTAVQQNPTLLTDAPAEPQAEAFSGLHVCLECMCVVRFRFGCSVTCCCADMPPLHDLSKLGCMFALFAHFAILARGVLFAAFAREPLASLLPAEPLQQWECTY